MGQLPQVRLHGNELILTLYCYRDPVSMVTN